MANHYLEVENIVFNSLGGSGSSPTPPVPPTPPTPVEEKKTFYIFDNTDNYGDAGSLAPIESSQLPTDLAEASVVIEENGGAGYGRIPRSDANKLQTAVQRGDNIILYTAHQWVNLESGLSKGPFIKYAVDRVDNISFSDESVRFTLIINAIAGISGGVINYTGAPLGQPGGKSSPYTFFCEFID